MSESRYLEQVERVLIAAVGVLDNESSAESLSKLAVAVRDADWGDWTAQYPGPAMCFACGGPVDECDCGGEGSEKVADKPQVGDRVLVRLGMPGPAGPVDPKNSASVEQYRRRFTRVVDGKVTRRPETNHGLYAVEFTIRDDNYDDWHDLMPDCVTEHKVEVDEMTIGDSWVHYDVEPEEIEQVIPAENLR